MRAFYLVLGLLVSANTFAQPKLFKDIHDETKYSTSPSGMGEAGTLLYHNRIYFFANTTGYGSEIWSTDGTAEGTRLLKDMNPGSEHFDGQILGIANDKLLIYGKTNYVLGKAIYASDGTEDGTAKLLDIEIGGGNITEVNGIFYFAGYTDATGYEIWRSDGTAEGTYMIKDIQSGVEFGTPYPLMTVVGSTIYFNADDGVHGFELWKTDGTEEGTTMVADINPDGNGVTSTEYLVAGSSLYFVAASDLFDYGLWKIESEGHEPVLVSGGYHPLGKIGGGFYGGFMLGDKIVYPFADENDIEGIYTINVTTDEMTLVKDIPSNEINDHLQLQLVEAHSKVYFVTSDGNDVALWSTDGTIANTVSAASIPATNINSMVSLTYISGNFYFLHYSYEGPQIVYSLFGGEGTSTFKLLTRDKGMTTPVGLNGNAFFFLKQSDNDCEPWISDGTTNGTQLLKDINTGSNNYVGEMITFGDKFLFVDYQDGLQSLWISGGMSESAVKFKDMRTAQFLRTNGKFAMFVGSEVLERGAPWITDGTAEGTFSLREVVDVEFESIAFTFVGDIAYFNVPFDGLWKTDGTHAGTTKVTEMPLIPGEGPFTFNGIDFKGELYFFYHDELWKSNGTSAGTFKITDTPGTLFTSAVKDSKIYYIDYNIPRLYVTDGTPSGTHKVKDIYASSLGTTMDGVLYFLGSTNLIVGGPSDLSLWRSDGTEEGTYQLKNIAPILRNTLADEFVVYNGALYFTAIDEEHGIELWKTDGTTDGTVIVKDIYPGPYSSNCASLIVSDGKLFFTANDGVHGTELWQTDGTETGTIFLGDVNPGSAGAFALQTPYVTNYVALDNRVFYASTASPFGQEIWYYGEEPVIIDEPVGLEDEFTSVIIWPNPATSTLVLNAPSFKTAILKDILGRDILTANVTGENTTIDISHLPRGMYFVKLKSENQSVITRRVILK
jgi:ELWxxDGT repeat protein